MNNEDNQRLEQLRMSIVQNEGSNNNKVFRVTKTFISRQRKESFAVTEEETPKPIIMPQLHNVGNHGGGGFRSNSVNVAATLNRGMTKRHEGGGGGEMLVQRSDEKKYNNLMNFDS